MSAPLGAKAVARATGVSTDTLRHYERKGLLAGIRRTPAGYRRYPPETIDRVLLIQRALVIGFSLDDLKRVLSVRDRGGAPCRSVHALVGSRLEALDRQIEDLATLASTPIDKPAHLLDALAKRDTIEKARCTRQRVNNPRNPSSR